MNPENVSCFLFVQSHSRRPDEFDREEKTRSDGCQGSHGNVTETAFDSFGLKPAAETAELSPVDRCRLQLAASFIRHNFIDGSLSVIVVMMKVIDPRAGSYS